MKKAISVFLATALLGTILSIPFSTSAELNWQTKYPTVINTYDDGELPENIADFGAAVTEYANGNKAIKISQYTTRSYSWPASFRILDSNNENSDFKPADDTAYKLSFKYRIDKAGENKPIAIELRYDKPNGDMSMSLDNLINYGYLKDTLVTSPKGVTTDGWVSFEKEITFSSMPDGSNPIYISVTTGLTDWVGSEGAIEVWIDDVTLEAEKTAEVMCKNYNGADKEITIGMNEKFSDLIPPIRKGYDFVGYYADRKYTNKISDDELVRNYEEFWAKWILTSDWCNLNSYDDGELPENIADFGAAVTEYANGNKAIKISQYTTRSYSWPASFRILDSNNGNSNFKPADDTAYKLSFKYRIDKAGENKPIAIELRYDKPNGDMSMSLDNLINYGYLRDTLVTSPKGVTTDGWVSFEKEITFSSMPDGSNPIYISVTTGLTDWVGSEGAIEVWIDDVKLVKTTALPIKNTYDDGELPNNIADFGAAVTEYANGNKAIKISQYTTRSYSWPASFRILDSNNGNSNFKPADDTAYKLSFKYRIDKAGENKPIAIELRYDKPNGDMSMSLDNLINYGYLRDTLVTSPTGVTTDGWVSFEKEVTFSSMPDGSNPIYISVTTGLTDWAGSEGAIEVWIDDVSLAPETPENHIRGDLNDDKAIDILDLIKIKKAATGTVSKNSVYDIDGNCVVADAGDITYLRKMILGSDIKYSVNFDGSVYNLVWNDEFDGVALDRTKWDDKRILMQNDNILQLEGESASGNGTLKINNGYLTLAAKKYTDENNSSIKYSTSMINTYNDMQFQYGYAEIRAKLPYGVNGAWPSWWATNAYSSINSGADATLPYGVEVDLVEVMNGSKTNCPNIHKWYREIKDINGGILRNAEHLVYSDSGDSISGYIMPNDEINDFHTYGFLWKENEMLFSIDGKVYNVLKTNQKFGEKDVEDLKYVNQPMNFIFTNWISDKAISEDSFTESEFTVDYIRLYQNSDGLIDK